MSTFHMYPRLVSLRDGAAIVASRVSPIHRHRLDQCLPKDRQSQWSSPVFMEARVTMESCLSLNEVEQLDEAGFCRGKNVFDNCTCSHQIDTRNRQLQEQILETHLEVKNQLLHNLEAIIDEQETRIFNMENFIQGRTTSLHPRYKQTLKGISVLSLDFGALSEENLALKESLRVAQSTIRHLQLSQRQYTDIPITLNANTQTIDNGNANGQSKINWTAIRNQLNQLQTQKVELRHLAATIQQATQTAMTNLKIQLEQYTTSYVNALIHRYRREVEARRRLHNRLVELNGNIRVMCRIRPPFNGEAKDALIHVDTIDPTRLNLANKSFTCDRVFANQHDQVDVFEEVSPIITSCIDGYNVCIFAYGHTGSGKTYTMEGPLGNPGINQRSIQQLFSALQQRDIDYKISLSMLEIYNEQLRDLLGSNRDKMTIRIGESGALEVPGLITVQVTDLDQVSAVLHRGSRARAISSTNINEHSSRSHAIVRVNVHGIDRTTGLETIGRLNLVDLAGSERVSQSLATGQQLKEAQSINRSLSELGNVVTALRNRSAHIPFRNCVLTRLLEDCLTGDSKTLVIIQLAPGVIHLAESISSLNFAEKIANVQTKSTSALLSPIKAKSPSNFVRFNSVREKNRTSSTIV